MTVELGLRPHNSQKRNTKMGFPLQCGSTVFTGTFCGIALNEDELNALSCLFQYLSYQLQPEPFII
jgi:hypothetical protein